MMKKDKLGFIHNEAQEEAIRSLDGPLLIISCPGSGKTTTLLRRIHTMIEHGIPGGNILMVTFTNAAAGEMKAKYKAMYQRDAGVTFLTIHSLCFNLLKREGRYDQADLMGEQECRHFFLESLKRYPYVNDPWETSRALMTEVSALRNNYVSISEYESVSIQSDVFRNLYSDYAMYKAERHKLDFDDILFECKTMLEHNPEILGRWRGIFRYIQCDEYQDTNPVQRDILYLLAGKEGNLCVVGDDDQSIYRFRGADPSIMLDFPKDYRKAKVIRMETNYRSALTVVQTAERLINRNQNRFFKKPVSERGRTGKVYGNVVYQRYESRKKELEGLVSQIRRLHDEGHSYEEMAILFRTNQQAMLPAMELSQGEIPYFSTEKIRSIYDGWIFQDLKAYALLALGEGGRDEILRVLNHPMRYLRDRAFYNVTFSYQGFRSAISYLKQDEYWKYKAADDKIRDWMDYLGPGSLRWEDSPEKLFRGLIGYRSIHYDEYLSDYAKFRNTDPKEFADEIDELKAEALRFSTIREWFDYGDEDRRKLLERLQKNDRGGVTLITMHKAKGLEWDTVFVIDVNQDVIPHAQGDEDPSDPEEERRLFYVAMTRARDNLYLMNSSKKESVFMTELLEERKSGKASEDLVGKHVLHKSFGEGSVEYCEDRVIGVNFKGETKRFLYPDAFEKGFLSFWKES